MNQLLSILRTDPFIDPFIFIRLRPRHSGTTIDWGFSGFVCVNPIGTERINNPDVAN